MKIKTKPYGEIEVDAMQKVTFPNGLYGFDALKEYYLLDSKEGPFYWLQSADEVQIAFVLIPPADFKQDYELSLNESDLKSLELDDKDDLIDFAIVTIPADPSKMTANLQGPVIINKEKRIGRQVISMRTDYSVKHSIVEEMRKQGQGVQSC